MNILFVGNTEGTSTSLHYFTSLLRLGHTVLPWDPDFFRSGDPIERLLRKVFRGPVPWKQKSINEKLVRLCHQNHFDLVFVMSENYISAEAIETIRREALHAPQFIFHSHDNIFSAGIRKPADFLQTLALYDRVFTTKSQNVERYRQLGQPNSYYIPSAYDPGVHRPIPREQSRLTRDLPVSFVGTYDHSRLAWLDKAGWDRTYIWGDGWQSYSHFLQHRDHIYPHAIYYFEFADVCSRSKISLGLLREEAEDRHTQRTFEIAACGSLQFAPRNEEIAEFFKENEEIVLYETPDELREKIDHYLAHETDRARIAQAGHRRCLSGAHTYADRVKTILSKLA